MGSLKRKKILAGRVRVSKRGWSMAMGPLKRKKTLAGRVRVCKRGWSMALGLLEKEEYSGWEGLSGDGRWPWGP